MREASLAHADSPGGSLLSSPLVGSPQTSPRASQEPPLSPRSANSRTGSGAFFSARSSIADSGRDPSRRDSDRREVEGKRDSRRRESDRPISSVLAYTQDSPESSPRTSAFTAPTAVSGVLGALAGGLAGGLAGLGFNIGDSDRRVGVEREDETPTGDDKEGQKEPSSSPEREKHRSSLGPDDSKRLSFASAGSGNRAPPPPPVSIPTARVTDLTATTGSDSPQTPGSAASSIRSQGHKKSNSLSRKPVPPVDPALLALPPPRQSSLTKVVESPTNLVWASSSSSAGDASPKPASMHREGSEHLASPDDRLRASPASGGFISPPPRDSSRASTPRVPPSPAFGSPPVSSPSMVDYGGMAQPLPVPARTPTPKSSSSPVVRAASVKSTSSNSAVVRAGSVKSGSSGSPLVRAASLKSVGESPRIGSPAQLERAKTMAKARKEEAEVLTADGDEDGLSTAHPQGRTVRGVDLSAVGSDVVGSAPAGSTAASAALAADAGALGAMPSAPGSISGPSAPSTPATSHFATVDARSDSDDWRPQTPPNQRRDLFDATASPRSILSSPQSPDGLELSEQGAVSLSSAQVVTATPAHARVVSLSNGLRSVISPDGTTPTPGSRRTSETGHTPTPSVKLSEHAPTSFKMATQAAPSPTPATAKARPMSSPPSPTSPHIPPRSDERARSHSKSTTTSATTSEGGHEAYVPRGLGFNHVREDGVERITVADADEGVPGDKSHSLGGNLKTVNLNSATNTPNPSVSETMPGQGHIATGDAHTGTAHQSHRAPTTPSMAAVVAQNHTASPHASVRSRQGSQSSKFRLPFRSPRPGTNGGIADDAHESDMSPPLSPASSRLRTQSITKAFRLRRNTNTPPGSPPVRTSQHSSDDHSTLPMEYGLTGLGLGNFALAPSAYRTPSGGIGYTPPSKERKLSLSAQEAFATAREKQAAEQAEALAAFRRSEKKRFSVTSPAHTHPSIPDSRVTSMAMSTSEGPISEDSHYELGSDELPQSLSLAVVTAAGHDPVQSPVDQLSAAASAARKHRLEARDSPTSPTAGDEGAADRERARAVARKGSADSASGDRADEFHDAVSELEDDEESPVKHSPSAGGFVSSSRPGDAGEAGRSLNGYGHGSSDGQYAPSLGQRSVGTDTRSSQDRQLTGDEGEQATLVRRDTQRREKDRLRKEAALLAAAEEERLEALRVAEEEERLERERLEQERLEQERLEQQHAERAEAERLELERLEEERRVEEYRRAEAERLEEEQRRKEEEEEDARRRAAEEEEERVLAAQREAERAEAERLEAERLAAERAAEEERARVLAVQVAERKAREVREREEVTRQLVGGKAEGGVMLRGVSRCQRVSWRAAWP